MILKENQRQSNFNDILLNIAYSIPMVLTNLGMFAYFVVNITDVTKATAVAYTLFAVCLFYSKYCIFIFQKPRIRVIFDELQRIVNESKW